MRDCLFYQSSEESLLSEGTEGKTNKYPSGFILALPVSPIGLAEGNSHHIYIL
jgi:hypothetical protein